MNIFNTFVEFFKTFYQKSTLREQHFFYLGAFVLMSIISLIFAIVFAIMGRWIHAIIMAVYSLYDAAESYREIKFLGG